MVNVVLLVLLLLCLRPGLLLSAESVRVVIEGLQGKPLENVRAFLRLPPGMVTPDGRIDKTLFEEFEKRIPAHVEEGLQPFGYYTCRDPGGGIAFRERLRAARLGNAREGSAGELRRDKAGRTRRR